MLGKIVIKQCEEIFRLKKENSKLKDINKELNSKSEYYIKLENEMTVFSDKMIRNISNLHELNNMEIEETEKIKHMNIIINRLLKICTDKINELDSRQTN